MNIRLNLTISKMIKKYLSVFVLLMLALNVHAEDGLFRVVETISSEIVLSNDGTGIVKNIYCTGCDFNMVKITENSKATRRGIAVDIVEVKKLTRALVMVSFNPKTREVQYIRW